MVFYSPVKRRTGAPVELSHPTPDPLGFPTNSSPIDLADVIMGYNFPGKLLDWGEDEAKGGRIRIDLNSNRTRKCPGKIRNMNMKKTQEKNHVDWRYKGKSEEFKWEPRWIEQKMNRQEER